MNGFNKDLQSQIQRLEEIIMSNKILNDVLTKATGLELQNYYIGAGCIAQTVWNHQMNFEPAHGISDIDFVYYDNSDLSSKTYFPI
jgi:hypothetical protein